MKMTGLEIREGLDSTSKMLRSGRLVSAALRRKVEGGVQILLLDINIDPEGKLPWLPRPHL